MRHRVSFYPCVGHDKKKDLSCVIFSHSSRDSVSPRSPWTCASCDQHISVWMYVCLSIISLPVLCLLIYPPCCFCSSFFFIPPLPIHMMQGGMRATEVGCVTIATSWLTGRTVPLFFESQGDQQWIQPLSCDGSVYLLILGGQETPLLWANRCSILRPGVADDGEKGGGEGDHGCFWFLL